jgi:hypothetical protein
VLVLRAPSSCPGHHASREQISRLFELHVGQGPGVTASAIPFTISAMFHPSCLAPSQGSREMAAILDMLPC